MDASAMRNEEMLEGYRHKHLVMYAEPENPGNPMSPAKVVAKWDRSHEGCFLDGYRLGENSANGTIRGLEKENAELKTQIEKMKCYMNCGMWAQVRCPKKELDCKGCNEWILDEVTK